MSDVFIVKLDVPRPIRWTFGAQARLGSLPNPPIFTDLAKPRKCHYAICAFVWAALAEKNHPLESFEDVAEYINTVENRDAATQEFIKAFKAHNEGASKKASAEPAPSPASTSA